MDSKPDLKEQARRLYQEGKSYRQITDLLNVSKSSVSRWCADLKNQSHPVILTSTVTDKVVPLRDRKRTRNQTLTDKQVIKLRRQVKASGYTQLPHYAALYKCTRSSLSDALRGKTFAHLNLIEPPITERLPSGPQTHPSRVTYSKECVICERKFKAKNKYAEVCPDKACRALIKQELNKRRRR